MPGYDYTFVREVQAEYSCPICECPMREPVQTKCGHRFCKECLEKSLKRRRKCPIDRRTLDEHNPTDIYPDVAIKRTILDFIVKCPNESNGCKWIDELRNVETHEAACELIEVECTNKDCKITPLKKDLLKHLTSECPMRNVECRYCKTCFVQRLKQDHYDVCTKYPMPCLKKCGEQKIPRDKMNDHIENSCPHTKVDCTFSHIGCKVRVQRRAIGDHVKASTESHLKLACEKLQEFRALSTVNTTNIKELEAQMDTANKKITQLSEIFLKIERRQELRDRQIALTEVRLNELEKRDEEESEDEELLKLRDEVSELQILVPKCNSLQYQLREEFTWTKRKQQRLEEAFSKLNQRQSKESHERWSDNEGIESRLQDVARSVKEVRDQLSANQNWWNNFKDGVVSIFCIIVIVFIIVLNASKTEPRARSS